MLFTHCDLSLQRFGEPWHLSKTCLYNSYPTAVSPRSLKFSPNADRFQKGLSTPVKCQPTSKKCRYGERRTSLWRGKKSDKLDQTSEKAVHFQTRKCHHLLGFFTFSVCCFLLLQDPQSLSVGQKRGGSLLRLHSLVHIQSVY